MTGWPVKTLGDVCVLVNGATPDTKVKDYWGGKHAWITPAEMGGLDSPFLSISRRTLSDKGLASCSATLVPPKTVILSSRAPIGHLVINEVPMATNQGCKSLIPKDGLDFSFLYYYLKANVELLESLGTGTTFKELSGTQLKTVEIPMPPLGEQKRIVELLDAATARVTELTACYEQARAHANNLFTSALRELMEKCDNTTEMTLSDICIVDWGNTDLTQKSYRSNGKYLAVSATGPDGRIGHAEHKAFTPVLSAIGARCGRMFLPEEDFTAIKNTITLTPIAEVASGKYIFFLFEHLSLPIRGAAQPFISKGDIEKFEVSVPPLDEQKRIVGRLDAMRAKTSEMVAAYDAKLQAAKNLRQSILESAFEGKL